MRGAAAQAVEGEPGLFTLRHATRTRGDCSWLEKFPSASNKRQRAQKPWSITHFFGCLFLPMGELSLAIRGTATSGVVGERVVVV